jgi:hypothetical protein
MSVTALLVPLAIAIIAMLVKAAILNRWVAQAMAADFFFALVITVLPVVLHA